jgi:hypothetical protein
MVVMLKDYTIMSFATLGYRCGSKQDCAVVAPRMPLHLQYPKILFKRSGLKKSVWKNTPKKKDCLIKDSLLKNTKDQII